MARDEAFVQAICENPDDDTPRLVYADWLDEHGDSDRAEFIRVQVRLAGGDTKGIARLRRRERELLLAHEREWSAPLHGIVRRARFFRGFPERVTLTAESFLAHADTLFGRAPARHLILTEVGGFLPQVADSPHLDRVRVLEFRTFGGQKIRTLVRSPHLGRLTGLVLRFAGLEDKGAAVLAAAPTLARLTTLDLYGNNLGPAGVRSITSSPHLAGLTELVLGDNEEVGDTGPEELAGLHARLSGLTRLHLSYTGLGDDGARALADAPHLAGLRVLDLGHNRIGAAGARALADSPHLKGLTYLGLRGNPLGRRARQTLAGQHAGRVRL
jgi:uncharacterized protein (TIGR02996 family)